MPTVRIETVSWLSKVLGPGETGRGVFQEEIEAGATVRDLFQALASGNPDFARHVFDVERRELTGHVTVIINDRVLDLLDGLDTEIRDGDTLVLLPSFSGGL